MSFIFQQPEWKNFLIVTAKRPWLWPLYLADLSRLFFRRIINFFPRKIFKKNHYSLRSLPSWLRSNNLVISKSECNIVHFSEYSHLTQKKIDIDIPKINFDKNDPENYLSLHRWEDCLAAIFKNKEIVNNTINQKLYWIENSLPKSDAAWETYSSCERAVNLIVMFSVYPICWKKLELDKKKLIINFLVESASWINNHLEYYGEKHTNNHILNNARALVVIGSFLGNEFLVKRGLTIFQRMSRKLFKLDGFLRERSSHYQYVVMNWLSDTLHFSKSLLSNSDESYQEFIELNKLCKRVSSATALLINSTKNLNTYIGDISPDHHPLTSILRLNMLYPEIISDNSDSTDFEGSEWYFISSNMHQLITCGIDSYPIPYTTHGHSDLGSFVWSYNHSSILVDPGCTSYISNDITKSQRGVSGHNVLVVSGLAPVADSLLKIGAWHPKPYSSAVIEFQYLKNSGFLLNHSGYSRAPNVGNYSRLVVIEDDHLVVNDSLEGAGDVELELYWHFAPDFIPKGKSVSVVANSLMDISIQDNRESTAKSEWIRYPYASAYGDQQEAYMLQKKYKVSLPWKQTTRFRATLCVE